MFAPKNLLSPPAIILCYLLVAGCSGDQGGPRNTESQEPSLELATLSEKELADGWISLFDGQTLFGWKPHCEANFRVENGTIVVDEGDVGLLCTTTEFDNYVLQVDFRADAGTNSGIFLRTAARPTEPGVDCHELNIAPPDNPFPTGSLVGEIKASETAESTQWQTFEATIDQGHIVITLDGQQVCERTESEPIARGLIGLQHNEGKVEFRNIKLKPLLADADRIFNGKDLAGWTEYPDMDSEFTVTDEGYLNVKNGRGQLETKGQYGDFILQLECISNAKHLNSGIFIRCIPGDVMMGYESQIHNGFKDDDRTKPIDHGTGGFFKRQEARIVVAEDKAWFYKTIIAHGSHMAAWVNGMQVSDWTDDRAPHENPREGLRTAAGTIMIQGHDPTTDLSFRNLRARELAGNTASE